MELKHIVYILKESNSLYSFARQLRSYHNQSIKEYWELVHKRDMVSNFISAAFMWPESNYDHWREINDKHLTKFYELS